MKKIQVGHLNRKHLKKLRRLQRHRLTIVSRQATILILSHQGKSCSRIADIVGQHVQTVRDWIKAFNRADRKRRWDLFKPKPRPGRTPTFDERVQQGLLDIFEESPRRYGFSDSEWTLHRLAEVAVRTGLVSSISHESVRRLIDNSKRNCSALADLGAFGVTLSEAKGLVLRTNEIPRFAQNDRLSNYWRLTMARKTWV